MEELKEIHIGEILKKRVEECGIELSRIALFFSYSEEEVTAMYACKNLNTLELLRWSKLLKYDFFRLYSQHLVFYSPSASMGYRTSPVSDHLPRFRKNLYTKNMIDFILKRIELGEKTKSEVIEDYGIPKTTLYKWISKNKPTKQP